jgi:hypothetical protein
MVQAYWLIGREIVQEVQGGVKRAEYGQRVIENLSVRLTERYGSGFSAENIQLFRRFYLAYRERATISYPAGTKLMVAQKSYPLGSQSSQGFSAQLSWSRYRAPMRVEDIGARDF